MKQLIDTIKINTEQIEASHPTVFKDETRIVITVTGVRSEILELYDWFLKYNDADLKVNNISLRLKDNS